MEPEEPEAAWPQRPFRRGWRFNWPGVILMAIYCLAFVFYLYIRIRYTLDLGAYVWRAPPPQPRAAAPLRHNKACSSFAPIS